MDIHSELNHMNSPIKTNVMPRWQRKALENRANKTPTKTPSKLAGDRYIPSRSGMNLDVRSFNLMCKENDTMESDCNAPRIDDDDYSRLLKQNLLDDSQSKILSFKNKAPAPKDNNNDLRVLYTQNRFADAKIAQKQTIRHIPSQPERILDAPDLLDDYYLNLLSWNQENQVAVALAKTVYIWNAGSGEVQELMTIGGEEDHVTSVSWVQDGQYLAVGTHGAEVQLWDVEAQRRVRTMNGHQARVGALAWNRHILSSGSRDSTIVHHDVRIAEHHIATLRSHEQEICGLKWSPSGDQLASGGNDNMLCVWDDMRDTPRYKLTQHQAAVKALDWCPWERNLLASGGGTADRTVKFWNTQTGSLLNSIDTKSQVCAIQWSKLDKELVTSHGFSQNQLCVWKYPTMTKIAELTGHTSRVLHLALSPDGQTVLSGAADETLRFWKVFQAPEKKSVSSGAAASGSAAASNFPAANALPRPVSGSSMLRSVNLR